MISKRPNEQTDNILPAERENPSPQVALTATGDGRVEEVTPQGSSPMEIKVPETGLRPTDSHNSDDHGGTLLAPAERDDMRVRWSDIQGSFVDDPKHAVEAADNLVGEAIQRLSEVFQDTRGQLEQDWGHGDDSVSTEQLRQALKRYRTFFDQILAV